MKNAQIAEIFRDTAKILELKGDNPFRIRAYEKAAFNIENLSEDLNIVLKEGDIAKIPGIGKDLAAKIEEIIKTKTFKFYEDLKKNMPPDLILMLEIPGLGPKTIKNIYDKLKIDTIDKLEEAARKGELELVEGVKRKTEDNIIKGIKLLKERKDKIPLYIALNIANTIIGRLKGLKEVIRIERAGSIRRRKETVKDIDILVTSASPRKVIDAFIKIPEAKDIILKGETKVSILAGGLRIQVDLRVVKEESFGSALMYFTGSKQFNIKLRQIAVKRGYKINEYGVFNNMMKTKTCHSEELATKNPLCPAAPARRVCANPG